MSNLSDCFPLPSRSEVIQVIEELLNGSVSRQHVSAWAAKWVVAVDPVVEDDVVWECLKLLMAADLRDMNESYTFQEEDFRAWMDALVL